MTRALTVRQPWADLIMAGVKKVENRTWPVPSTLPFPFRLWIHAAAKVDRDAVARIACGPDEAGMLGRRWERHVHSGLGMSSRLGVLLGSVEVTGCHHANDCWDLAASDAGDPQQWCSRWAEPGVYHWDVYHWELSGPRPLVEPVPAKGRLGLWRLDTQLTQAVPS